MGYWGRRTSAPPKNTSLMPSPATTPAPVRRNVYVPGPATNAGPAVFQYEHGHIVVPCGPVAVNRSAFAHAPGAKVTAAVGAENPPTSVSLISMVFSISTPARRPR